MWLKSDRVSRAQNTPVRGEIEALRYPLITDMAMLEMDSVALLPPRRDPARLPNIALRARASTTFFDVRAAKGHTLTPAWRSSAGINDKIPPVRHGGEKPRKA